MGINVIPSGGGNQTTGFDAFDADDKRKLPPVTIPTTRIPDGDQIAVRFRVPSGQEVKVWEAGVQTLNNTTVSGLGVWIEDETNNVFQELTQTKRATGDPLQTFTGAVDISLFIDNQSGNEQDANGYWKVTVEDV